MTTANSPMPIIPGRRHSVWRAILRVFAISMGAGFLSGVFAPAHRNTLIAEPTPVPVVGSVDRQAPPDSIQSGSQDPFESYQIALASIKSNLYSNHFDDTTSRNLTYEAIKGMMGSLHDQFSAYLDPNEWRQLVTMTEGHFGGIGALMESKKGKIFVARPIPGGPAERAGVRSNDELVAIDSNIVNGQSLDDLGKWLEGQTETSVQLTVLRDGRKLTLSVVRGTIEPTVVERWMEDDSAKIGHIVLTEFNRKSAAQLTAAYNDLEKRGMRALVLDLRFNPGGLLDAAVDVASIFIPERSQSPLNDNVVIIHRGDGDEEGLTLEPQFRESKQVPLAVLVNGGSASAAEIVTGALRDYGVGEIVGERTFGKGKVQTLFEMNHGKDGGIRLTTSLYYPPRRYDINFKHDEDGNRIPGTGGIVPDLVVPASPKWRNEFEDKANDNQLMVAMQFLRGRLAGKSVAEAGALAMSVPGASVRTAFVKPAEPDHERAEH